MAPSQDDVTQLLVAWSNGDRAALDKVMPLVYQDLRHRARRCMSGQATFSDAPCDHLGFHV